jgi:hypothetical protein
MLQLNNLSKVSGFIDKKIFEVAYLQLSGNHVKFYVNCVNKRSKILPGNCCFAEKVQVRYNKLLTGLFPMRN